ncbi:unnamed protein product (macronuclear) [Paramecium tetraurelia]|uniref:Protein kinase domain-containing protein n=1 Tax=Paramecium tetraurelia TaxID=5888 RepID=A0C6P0_PARTE|nr:uncharacterized protein GSPATT00035586001 [Paramecium tetraurelia]CAK66457.1 unnamed protein product [Paramecium tetraurelia]|eukprot:XP_001433854.1 hypothetical protein (macronuclear) [Paramecium tetraurelia strain d4-2]
MNELMQGLLQDDNIIQNRDNIKKINRQTIQNIQQDLFYFREVQNFNLIERMRKRLFQTNQKNLPLILHYSNNFTAELNFIINHSVEIDLFLKELSKCIIDGFDQQHQSLQNIGTGSTAQVRLFKIDQVFLAENSIDHKLYAVKQIEKEQVTGRHRVLRSKTSLEEIFMMWSLDHPNIMKLHQIYESEKHIRLIICLFKENNLSIKSKILISYSKERWSNYQLKQLIIGAPKYLKLNQGIMHQDLKPFNILYKNKDPLDWQFGIGDFGFSTQIKQQQQHMHQKLQNIKKSQRCMDCPAIVRITKLNSFYNSHSFKSKTKDDTFRQNVNDQINYYGKVCIPQSLKSFIISKVRKNPLHRFTLQQCLDYDFYKENLSKFNQLSQEIQEQIQRCSFQTQAEDNGDSKHKMSNSLVIKNTKQQKKAIFTSRFLCYTETINLTLRFIMNKYSNKTQVISLNYTCQNLNNRSSQSNKIEQILLLNQNQLNQKRFVKFF